MKFRKPTKREVSAIVKVHILAFRNFFLSELGHPFLKIYYKAVITNKESIAICAINDENELVGFATGCEKSKGYNKRLVFSSLIPFLIYGLKLILIRPKAIWRIMKNFEKNSTSDDDGNYAELLSIAVKPQVKGFGVGKRLLEKFEDEALFRGCRKIALTTDFYENDTVVGFYKKCGYKTFYDFTTYPNRRMYKMIKDLAQK